ncbi:MAG: nucleotidyltransferase family protein [Nitrospira sp.]|nr:nucleotidyltransferase family protein [Nitrospira sp.]
MRIDEASNAPGIRGQRRGPSTAIIVLAAGASTRMGRPKQLLIYGSHSLLRHAASVAIESRCGPIFVVLGAYASRLHREIDDLQVRSVLNERWADGLGSSIQAGLAALTTSDGSTGDTGAVILMLCDQPYVTAAVINNLVTAYHTAGKGIIASEYDGTLGVPALFGREYFMELATMSGAAGAKRLIAAHASEVVPVPFPKGMTDIDTAEDYGQLRVPWRRSLSSHRPAKGSIR